MDEPKLKLTPALVRAMAAILAGRVRHRYTYSGNVFEGPKGIAPSCYRRLEMAGYIQDGPSVGLKYPTSYRVLLSRAGIAARWAESGKGEGE